MSGPVTLIGLGATKAGTSWLYDYLRHHPDCHFRRVKELHYFDAFDGGNPAAKAKALRQKAQTFRETIPTAPGHRVPGLQEALRDHEALADLMQQPEDHAAYLAYLSDGQRQKKVQGDITPAYGLLSVAKLREIASLAGDIRFVYLLRDPVSRLWSHVRMMAARQNRGVVKPGQAARILTRALKGKEPQITKRGDYKTILGNVAQAIDPAKRLVLFSDDLFYGNGLTRLCDFLGVKDQRGNTGDIINAGRPLDMTTDQAALARDYLQEQYDYVAGVMGDMPQTWQHSLAKV